jgi:hypothetical protein
MKIKDLIFETPEMTEEKLLTIIDENLKMVDSSLRRRLKGIHKEMDLNEAFLNEYDLIQDKKSNLTRGERDIVIGFVGTCMIEMTKGKEVNE